MSKINKPVLQHRRVMITRPVRQSQVLKEKIESLGGQAIVFPVIAVEAVKPATQDLKKCAVDVVIFISRNAADFLDEDWLGELVHVETLAVGKGTVKCLMDRGVQNVTYPVKGIGSEGLLALPALQEKSIKDREILIVRGLGGREMLEQTLSARGARVSYLEVYRRTKPDTDPEVLKKIWQEGPPDAIVVTSTEGLQNLVEMTSNDDKKQLYNVPLIVISDRLASYALECGFNCAPVVAATASDSALAASVVRVFEDV